MTDKTLQATIIRDGDDLVLVFPPEVIDHLKKLGLGVGDEVTWVVGSDGTVIITPKLSPEDSITFDVRDLEANS